MKLEMSSLAGVLAIATLSREQSISVENASELLIDGLPGYGQYNYKSGLALLQALRWDEIDSHNSDWHTRLRHLIDRYVTQLRPAWRSLVPYGRNFALAEMDDDAVRCLRDAGLLDDTEAARQWWDRIGEEERLEDRRSLLEIGREGEACSMEHERSTLASAGRTDLTPEWSALLDNTLGFDIRSWHVQDPEALEKTIEVKASRTSPVLIHVTRHEWVFAVSARRHEFHVWDLSRHALRVISVEELTPNVPTDRGSGEWAEFTLAVDVT